MKKILTACLLVVVASLAACGGGGSSGASSSTGSGSGTSSSDTFRITFNTAALNFDMVAGQTTAVSKVITATSNTTTTKTVVIVAEANGPGILSPIKVETAGPMASNITVSADPTLKAGTYTGAIRLRACTTTACTEEHPGSPQTVNYTIRVRTPIQPSQSSVALSASEGASGNTVSLGLVLPDGSGDVSYKVTYPASQNVQWLKVTRNTTGGLDLQGSATGLAAGTYTASLDLVAAQPELSVSVPVTFTVNAGVAIADTVNIDLASATQPDSLKGSVTITGVTAGTWTAAVASTPSQSWLKVDTASGSVGGAMAWHVDATAMAALANNAVYTGNVTVTVTGVAPKTIAFRLNKHLAQLRIADTYALQAGIPGDVMVYGSGLNQVDGQAVTYRIGSFSPRAVTRLSDNASILTMPALDVGSYDITLGNAAGLPVSKATLKVLAQQTYVYQALATTGDKASLQWDDEGKQLFVVNNNTKMVERYTPSATTGLFVQSATRQFANGIEAIGLTRDHSALIVSSGANTFYKVSPTDLTTQSTFVVGTWSATPDYQRNPLPVLGDNRVMISNYGMLDLDSGVTTAYAGNVPLSGLAPYGDVTPDGNTMLITGAGSAPGPITAYTVAYAQFLQLPQATSQAPFTRSSSSRSGSVWLQGSNVYDVTHRQIGAVNPPAGWTGVAGVVSSFGTRIYVYATNGSAKPRVYVFNSVVPATSGASYPILGYIEMPDRADCAGGFVLPTCIANVAQMALSSDDRTVFIIGDRNLLVQPVTGTLTPVTRAMGGRKP